MLLVNAVKVWYFLLATELLVPTYAGPASDSVP